MTTARPKLPSVLPSQPAIQDGMFISSHMSIYMSCYRMVVSTTKDQISTGLARATNPAEYVECLPAAYNALTLRQDTDLYLCTAWWVGSSGGYTPEMMGINRLQPTVPVS